jgi:eukaryotic-like serine/threonine-protein kinase
MIGQVLGHYRVLDKIGGGGMGEVYRAHDETLDRDVALKVLPPGFLEDDSARRQFRKEALALAKLNHPNVETVYEFNTQDGVDFLAMELIHGRSLREVLSEGAQPEQQVLSLGCQLALGLSAAHEQNIVHRDLKPGNLMVTPDGRLKILDFGLARLLKPAQAADVTLSAETLTGSISGTVPYMSPEQLRGQRVDVRSDVYAAGAVLYEMATGRRPFTESQGAALIGAILHENPEPPASVNSRVSQSLQSVILKALEKDVALRYQSARELLTALEPVSAGTARTTPLRRTRVLAAAVAATAVILVIGLLVGYRMGGLFGLLRHRSPTEVSASAPIKTRRSVAVLGFKNVSERQSEAWLSTALAEMLTTELAAGEQLRTVPGESVARMKTNLALPETDSYGKDTLDKIRRNLNADDVVLGSFVPLGESRIRVDLRLQDTHGGELLAVASVTGDESQIDSLVSQAGSTLRQKLGVSTISTEQALAVKATLPQNRDAARFYAEGLRKLRQYDYLAARDLLSQAVAAQPQFALAHSALATAWKGLGYDTKAREEVKKAFDLSSSFSREDRLAVEGQYHEFMNERTKAVDTYRTLFDFFPDNLDYGLRLGSAQVSASKGQDALTTVATLRKIPSPASEDPRIDLVEATAASSIGDYKRQYSAASQSVAVADTQGARWVAAQARISECSSLRYLGKPQESVSVCEDAKKMFEEIGDRGNAARALNNIGVVYMEQTDLTHALAAYDAALSTAADIGDRRLHGMILNNLAGVLHAQFKLADSQKSLEQAMADFREIGESGGVIRCLENIGTLLADEGELRQARRNYEQALSLAQQIQNRSLEAYAHFLLAEVYLQQDQLAVAKKHNDLALQIRTELGEQRAIPESKMAAAGIALEQQQFAVAESTARGVLDQFAKTKSLGMEAGTYGILARALWSQGKKEDAQSAIAKASELTRQSDDPNARLRVNIESARIAASSSASDIAKAKKDLADALQEATRQNLTGIQFEARLAMGEVEVGSGERSAGKMHLGALERDAKSKGFLLIARKAGSLAVPK